MALKALIVDNEHPARQELRYLLEQFHNIEIVGEAASTKEAMALIQALEYDILFLDINMPGMSGLELAEKLKSLPKKPSIIFITAYDNFALNAFNADAEDYILKPIEKARLKHAIDKVAAKRGSASAILSQTPESVPVDRQSEADKGANTGRILAESGGRFFLIDIDEIYYAFSAKDMVYLKTATEKMLTRLTLRDLEAKLNSNFIRTHRSFLVNIQKVKEIEPFFNGTYRLIMNDKGKSEIPVSRSQAKTLKKLFG